MHIIGCADVFGDDAVKFLRIIFGRARFAFFNLEAVVGTQMADDIAHDRQRMFVILGQMIDHARFLGVQVAPAEIFCADFLPRCRLHQRRACEEDGALFLHDHRLVRHRRHIGTAGGATAHHAGDLWDRFRRHIRLIEEDAAEMFAVGKNLCLMRQVRPAAINEIDAR